MIPLPLRRLVAASASEWFVLRSLAIAATWFAVTASAPAAPSQSDLRRDSLAVLNKAATYYRTHVASHGGYVYFYSEDLQQRWGEGTATRDQIFVQPPGTPTVGMAFLAAYRATGDTSYLDASKAAAHALVHGQLQSGGWTQTVDFNPTGSRVALYRNGKGQGRNHTSLDDNQTQSAIAFLARIDEALQFNDAAIHEAARYALDALLKAQFPNGAFPQGFTGPVASHPIKKANYPASWPRTWPNEKYWDYYTLNDGLAGSVSETLLVAHQVYRDARYLAALKRLGDFLILAQMPEPQPAWAQQYNYEMQPMWARRFEPPAIAGLESEDAIRTLLKIHRATGDRKYLEPIPRALAYLAKNRLPDGKMARYYELQTNRPLYMNRRGQEYFLTYDDSNLPSHYGWKQETTIDELARQFAAVQGGRVVDTTTDEKSASQKTRSILESEVRRIIGELDAQGRWVSTYAGERLVGQPKFAPGFRYLSSAVFSKNVETLSEYLAAARSAK